MIYTEYRLLQSVVNAILIGAIQLRVNKKYYPRLLELNFPCKINPSDFTNCLLFSTVQLLVAFYLAEILSITV